MTKEMLQTGIRLLAEIEQATQRIEALNGLDDEVKDSVLEVRVRGINLKLPKALFRQELRAEKEALEVRLSTLQTQFNAL